VVTEGAREERVLVRSCGQQWAAEYEFEGAGRGLPAWAVVVIIFVAGMVVGMVAGCWLAAWSARPDRCLRLAVGAPRGPADGELEKLVRDMETQSMVTYRRDLTTPRFQVLGASQQGAWPGMWS